MNSKNKIQNDVNYTTIYFIFVVNYYKKYYGIQLSFGKLRVYLLTVFVIVRFLCQLSKYFIIENLDEITNTRDWHDLIGVTIVMFK